MSDADVKRLVDSYRAGWFSHDVDTIMAVVAANIVFQNLTNGERVEGADGFRQLVSGIFERWPDLRFDEHAVYFSADTGVAEWTAMATASDGRRLEWDGIDVINCRDGLISRNAVYSSGHAPRVLGA
jgi:ketosteroid isomerase-like protein